MLANNFIARCLSRALIIFAVLSGSGISAYAEEWVRIQNLWKPHIHIHTEHNVVEAGEILGGWWHAQWEITPGFVESCVNLRIRGRDKYLRYQRDGTPQLTFVGSRRPTAEPSLEFALTRSFREGYFRISPCRSSRSFLHIEHGDLQVGSIETGWWSALWRFAPISEEPPANPSPKQTHRFQVELHELCVVSGRDGALDSEHEFEFYGAGAWVTKNGAPYRGLVEPLKGGFGVGTVSSRPYNMLNHQNPLSVKRSYVDLRPDMRNVVSGMAEGDCRSFRASKTMMWEADAEAINAGHRFHLGLWLEEVDDGSKNEVFRGEAAFDLNGPASVPGLLRLSDGDDQITVSYRVDVLD